MIIPKKYYYRSQTFLDDYVSLSAQEMVISALLNNGDISRKTVNSIKPSLRIDFIVFAQTRIKNKRAGDNYTYALNLKERNNEPSGDTLADTFIKTALAHMRIGIEDTLKMRWYYASNGRNIE